MPTSIQLHSVCNKDSAEPMANRSDEQPNKTNKKNIYQILGYFTRLLLCLLFFLSFCYYHLILPHPLTPLRNSGLGILIPTSFFLFSFLGVFFLFDLFVVGCRNHRRRRRLKERTDGRTGVGGIDTFPGTPGYLSRSYHSTCCPVSLFFLLPFFRFTLYRCDVYVPVRAGEKRRRRRSRQGWRSWREGVVAAGRGDGDGNHV